ncbi:MAG: hypothetical protein ACSLE1_19695, partial [Sphingobium sp.]
DVLSESRMREICTSGSMSREWKRTVWQAPQARRTTPRHFLTLPLINRGLIDGGVLSAFADASGNLQYFG